MLRVSIRFWFSCLRPYSIGEIPLTALLPANWKMWKHADTATHSGIQPHDVNSPGYNVEYTVPTIHYVPTDTYIMDSQSIAAFLEKTYPNPPLPLTSELGREIQQEVRKVFPKIHGRSLRPREVDILSPRSQEFFRNRAEPMLGHPLEDLLADPSEEDATWKDAHEGLVSVNKLMETNAADGPFLLGTQPSFTDFSLVGSLQSARVISEDVFKRVTDCPAFQRLYDACSPWMERKN